MIWPVLSVRRLVVCIFSGWSAKCESVSRIGTRILELNDFLVSSVQLSSSDVLVLCYSIAESVGVLL